MFTPVHTSLGALLLHQASTGLLQHNGRVFGISSLLSGSVAHPSYDNIPIILGLICGVIPVYWAMPSLLPAYPAPPSGWESGLATLGIGLLVGWGTKNDHGCTSGHMLCGLSRLSPRSLIATGIFFVTALISANTLGGKNPIIPPCTSSQPCYTPTYPSTPELVFMASAVGLSTILNTLIIPYTFKPSQTTCTIASYISGVQFGLGLIITGMADPAKVLRFFSLTDLSNFDPSLALVMLLGVGPNILSYLLLREKIEQKKSPMLAPKFRLPTATVADIDWRFVAGAVAFGAGWGLSGVCPGPGLLRSVLQPAWGLIWMGGFLAGSLAVV
ncbi:hypothetical protein FQN54_005977 [Arachnomyces sp. PD_36]|nr:hypothetical protein FQN54_005977 [Arachnomyces sp. PD_36]